MVNLARMEQVAGPFFFINTPETILLFHITGTYGQWMLG
jgi:hypothetical protein